MRRECEINCCTERKREKKVESRMNASGRALRIFSSHLYSQTTNRERLSTLLQCNFNAQAIINTVLLLLLLLLHWLCAA